MSNVANERGRPEALGLDLGGYTGGRSALASAKLLTNGGVKATICGDHAFASVPRRSEPFKRIVEREVVLLAACLDAAPLYVDVPLDLQGLPCPTGEGFAWQLVKRPVDHALGALPPLADRIGWVVARFENLRARLPSEQRPTLGDGLYETYPKGTLELSGLPCKGYKATERNTIVFDG